MRVFAGILALIGLAAGVGIGQSPKPELGGNPPPATGHEGTSMTYRKR